MDNFGYSVALDGERALVGSLLDDVGANSDQGSAYVFLRSGVTWSQQQKLTAADGAANDGFGVSVALTDVTAVVGASLDDIGAATNRGFGLRLRPQRHRVVARGTTDRRAGRSERSVRPRRGDQRR